MIEGEGAKLGEARVDIVPNLDPLAAGFAKAKVATTQFQTHATRTSAAATAAFAQLSRQSTLLAAAIRSIDGPLGGVAGRLTSANVLMRQTGPILAGMALGLGALTIATSDWLHATIDAEDTLVDLRQALRTSGRDAELSAIEMVKFSQGLSAITTAGDEAISQVQTRLVRFDRISSDVFPRATAAILDFAQATKRDLQTAALVVGGALQNPVQGLERLNRAERDLITGPQRVLIEDLARMGKEAEAADAILAALEARFKGTAEAARGTLGGSIQALKNSISDMTEVTGGSLANMTNAVNFLNRNLEETVDIIKVVGAVGGTLLVSRFFGPMTEAALTATAAEVQFQSALIRGNAVALNSVRAAEMKAGADVAGAQATLQAAKAETALAAAEVRSLALNREMIAAELALADARLQSHLARGTVVRGEGGKFRSGQTDELTRMAELQRTNAAMAGLQAKAEVELALAQAKEAEASKIATAAQAAHTAALGRASLAARVTTGALTAMRGVMAFFGGPVGLAITAAAAGFYLLSRNADEGVEKVDDFAGSMSALNSILDTAQQRLNRIALEERNAAKAKAEATLAVERNTLAEKQNQAARLETAVGFAKLAGIPSDIEAGTARLAATRAEIANLTAQVAELEKGLRDLSAIPPPTVTPKGDPRIDEEILRRRRDTIKSLTDESGALERLLPLYQSGAITLDKLNTSLQGEKLLTDLLLTSRDKEGRQLLDLIAKRDRLNKAVEITTELQNAGASVRVFDAVVPKLLQAGLLQEDLNQELELQVNLERDLIQLGLLRGSTDANRLEQSRRGEQRRNKDLENEFKRRELLAGSEEQIEALDMEADAFGRTAESAAVAAERARLVNQIIAEGIPITNDLAAEVDRLAKAFGDATANRDMSALLDDLKRGLSDTSTELDTSRASIDSTAKAVATLTYEQQAFARAALLVDEVLPSEAAKIRDLARAFGEAQASMQVNDLMKGLTDQVRQFSLETETMARTFGLTEGAAAQLRFEQQALADIMKITGEVSAENALMVHDLAMRYGQTAQAAANLAGRQDVMLAASNELSGIFSEMRRGVLTLGDAFMRLADSIADALLQASLFGQGPLAGVMGTGQTGGLIGGGIGALLGLGGAAGAAGAGAGAFEALGGIDAAMAIGALHKGRKEGEPRPIPSRRVPISTFVRAPRLHKGLRQGEFPAILEDGEEVTPKHEVRKMRTAKGDTFNFYLGRKEDVDSLNSSMTQLMGKASDAQYVSRQRNR